MCSKYSHKNIFNMMYNLEMVCCNEFELASNHNIRPLDRNIPMVRIYDCKRFLTPTLLQQFCPWTQLMFRYKDWWNWGTYGILTLERPGCTSLKDNCSHWCWIHPTFWTLNIVMAAFMVTQIGLFQISIYLGWSHRARETYRYPNIWIL